MTDHFARHRRPARLGVRLGTILAAAVWLGAGSAAAAEDIDKGRALAERLCAHCHMAPGQGEKQGRNDIPGFSAVARRRGQTPEGIVMWLRSIPPMMPNHHLTQDEMHALAAFIMTLRTASPTGPAR
jgi:mono/diheme cytochrome c family protein